MKRSGSVLGPSWGVLVPSCAILERLGAIWGASWRHLGASWGDLEASWEGIWTQKWPSDTINDFSTKVDRKPAGFWRAFWRPLRKSGSTDMCFTAESRSDERFACTTAPRPSRTTAPAHKTYARKARPLGATMGGHGQDTANKTCHKCTFR